MAITNGNDSWERIQTGVKETERLIGQRDYNSAMMKARQTLEFMVKQLSERAGIAEGGDLKDQIDLLFEHQWITKNTCEHYHKIRMIGNKAAHEGDQSAYNANQAYHMLSQEVYTFANNYSNAQKGSRIRQTPRTPAPTGRKVFTGDASMQNEKHPQTGRSSSGGNTNRNSVPNTRNSSAGKRSAPSRNQSRRRPTQRRRGFTVYDLLKLLIPVLCIVLLFLVVKLFKPDSGDTKPTKDQITTEASAQTSASDEPTNPSEPTVVYKTTTTLNVRPEPSTDAERIGQLPADSTVEYVRDYDSEWTVILYQGQEAYVASQYLTTE